jgi:hypothetical protein
VLHTVPVDCLSPFLSLATPYLPVLLSLHGIMCRSGNADSAAAQALKSQLVSNLGSQNVTLYAVEGLREVTASIMAGLAFVSTHNLAAPLAGSITVQVGPASTQLIHENMQVFQHILSMYSRTHAGCMPVLCRQLDTRGLTVRNIAVAWNERAR